MSEADPFRVYLRELQKNLAVGIATEPTHRPALKNLLEAMGNGISAVNEPRRVACGAPDFLVSRNGLTIGYVETKDVGKSLDDAERSEQLARYRRSLTNLILTDYLEFRWYVEGERRETARLATVTAEGKVKSSKSGMQTVAALLQAFFAQEAPMLGRPRELAERMAALASMMRGLIEETFQQEGEKGTLHAQLKAFQETLIPDLTPAQFADMYAQTITYGLFAARVRLPSGKGFTWQTAFWNLPPTNPFLQKLFREIAIELPDTIAWLVDDLTRLLARANMAEILRDFGKRTRQEDPVLHFYETFLAAYDPHMRQARGVYYTPEPVVSYIVRSLDEILKSCFHRSLGLADPGVLILDPAVGTATFLYFVIQQIHETIMKMGQAGAWSDYVRKHLLTRIFGFELLMAPYTVAHMKLGILLQETGYDFGGDQRLGIYLTNSLEEAITRAQTLGFAGFITDEANAAAEVKRDKPIMVVLGNPPYSVSSTNKGEYIEGLMERYKAAVRQERNIQPLSDDYIKFLRFAHDRIERTGHGIIGMITNHTYLSGLIHRGMREELLKSFDEIYILNLHGSALLGEMTPEGGKDENIFDIRQGVAILLAARRPGKTCEVLETSQVYYADLWGTREEKHRALLGNDIQSTAWQELRPTPPYFFFVPKEFDLLGEYEKGWRVPRIFMDFSTATGTGRDSAFVAFDRQPIEQLVQDLTDPAVSDETITERYGIRNTSGWDFFGRREALLKETKLSGGIIEYQYRLFDVRFAFYDPAIRRDSRRLMKHMKEHNLGLLLCQQQATTGFRHVFCTRYVVDESVLSTSTRERGYVFPLYLHPVTNGEPGQQKHLLAASPWPPDEEGRVPNLNPAFVAEMESRLGPRFDPHPCAPLPERERGMGGEGDTFTPEDILHYAYAVFHSPTYRARYAEFLKIDFPCLPLTSDRKLFRALAAKGAELVALHLLESPALNQLVTRFPVAGSNVVESVRYAGPRGETPGRVYINKMQYFEGVPPEVWAFQIGGYQVLDKWLKDRKGRALSFDDLYHYQKIVVALQETMRLMAEIDELIPSWPME